MPRRHAVLVGINDYGGGGHAPDLNSCIADVIAMEEILRTQYGFDRITTLLDAQATVQNVDAALDELFRGATPEDRLVFFYSGHGYRPFRSNGFIEVLVLHGGQFYEDSRLSAKTQQLPLGVLTVILDSCFAGGMFKILIPGPQGFEVARVKVWTPPAEQLRRESEELSRATRVEFKGFGLAPAVLPIAVAQEFGLPEPPEALKSFILAASRAPAGAGAPPGAASLPGPGLESGSFQPGASKGPAAGRHEIATAPSSAMPGAQPPMAGPAGQPGAAETAGAPARPDNLKCITPGIEPVTALDDIAIEETGASGVAGPSAGGMTGMTGGASGMTGMTGGAHVTPKSMTPAGVPGGTGSLLAGELELKGLLVAAAQANEPASAKTNQTEELSAFTFGLRRALRERGWDLSPNQLIPDIAIRLHGMGFTQTPLYHAPPNLPIPLTSSSIILLPRRGGVREAVSTAVHGGTQPGAGESTMPGGVGGGMGKAFATGSMTSPASTAGGGQKGTDAPEDTRLTTGQAKGLLELIVAAPDFARTVIETLSRSAATAPPTKAAGLEPVSFLETTAETGSAPTGPAGAAPDTQSPGEKQWLEAALAAAGVRR